MTDPTSETAEALPSPLEDIKSHYRSFASPDAAACTLFDDLMIVAEELATRATTAETALAELIERHDRTVKAHISANTALAEKEAELARLRIKYEREDREHTATLNRHLEAEAELAGVKAERDRALAILGDKPRFWYWREGVDAITKVRAALLGAEPSERDRGPQVATPPAVETPGATGRYLACDNCKRIEGPPYRVGDPCQAYCGGKLYDVDATPPVPDVVGPRRANIPGPRLLARPARRLAGGKETK